MKLSTLATILLILSVILLGVVFLFNTYEPLSKLDNPVFGKGFGNLCSNENDCITFCQSNMGRCKIYCNENPENKFCSVIF